MQLNQRAQARVDRMLSRGEELRITVTEIEGGGRLIDLGIDAPGGLAAGLELAGVCLADLADVSLGADQIAGKLVATVQLATDHPVGACLASQYAGWQIAEGKFFAMGSGPMRAVAARESIFEKIGVREQASKVVGVLEGRKRPGPAIYAKIAAACGIEPSDLTLLIAPTASIAGGVQIVARSVETALHKLSELGFDLSRLVSGIGVAPLPPVAADDLAAIGRTNDAVLYGARVVLCVTGDDESLRAIGPKVPSSASPDHGLPFAAIFERYGRDFYKVDPHLFSPAQVVFQNVDTGRTHAFGGTEPEVLARSFFED
jgi:methenyltetrahydromethanopterin cyclohydrolase